MGIILVSIIVPVYKVEQWLLRCVESLVRQTLAEIEIILVDDGSPDECPRLCDEYAKGDTRVVVIHKENGGLSDARNAGLRVARGKYVLFVDADDFIIADACEQLVTTALRHNLDIVSGDARRVEGNAVTYLERASSSDNCTMTGPSFLKAQLEQQRMHMPAWLNLYSREFLFRHDLFFKKGILHEDEQWTPRVFLKAHRVQYLRLRFYNYFIRHDSITKSRHKARNGKDLLVTCIELGELYSSLDDPQLKSLLNDYMVMLYLHAVHFGDLYHDPVISSSDYLRGKSKSIKNKLKVALFMLNKHLYRSINIAEKGFLSVWRSLK